MKMNPKDRAREDLIRAMVSCGFPEEFGEVVASQLGGEKSMQRMTSYLRQARPKTAEEVADEMLAILAVRHTWVDKKINERANSRWNDYLNTRE